MRTKQLMLGVILALGLGLVSGAGKCPERWAAFGDFCYFVSDNRYNYDIAREICQAREGDLVTINSVAEREFVRGMVVGKTAAHWLGMERDKTAEGPENGWAWVDGSTPDPMDPDISDWYEGEPDGTGNCANIMVDAPYQWKDASCSFERFYICKRSNAILDKCDLEGGWHPYAGRCYKYFEDDSTWTDAGSTCARNRGTLAVLNTNEKLGIFREIVDCKDYNAGVWLGLSDTNSTAQKLMWVNGEAMTVDDFDEGQPKWIEDNQNCVEALTVAQYKWRVEACAKENHFVCERPEGTCANGWQRTAVETNFCYQVVYDPTQLLTWSDARDRCKGMGGNLISPKTQDEHNALKELVEPLREQLIPEVRIGFSDMLVDDEFVWDDGTPLDMTKWADGQPVKNPERWDCGVVNTANELAKWLTGYCFTPKPYICQIPLHKSPMDIARIVPICPDGWIPNEHTNECYYFDDNKMDYQTARRYCADMSLSHMIVVRDEQEQSFLNRHLRGATWVALEYSGSDYEWVDRQEKPSFVNWDLEQKDPDFNTFKHVKLRVGNNNQFELRGIWSNDRGTAERFVGCARVSEGSATLPTQPTFPGSPYCGVGWSYDPSSMSCFKLGYNGGWTFEEARQACLDEGEGSDLASINSMADQTYVNALIHNTIGGLPAYWIGLNDRDLDKGWQWTDGSPVNFFFWNSGEPNNAGGKEYCVEISPVSNDRWNDAECDIRFGYVCKKPSTLFTTVVPPDVTQPPEPCEGDGEPLLSGMHYVQDEDITANYFMDETRRYGSYEVKRDPFNARIDSQGEGVTTGECPNYITTGTETDNKYDYKVMNIEGWNDTPADKDYVLFEVQACMEVHVVLADQQDLQTANVYEVILGNVNNKIAIRRCLHLGGCGYDAQRDVEDALNCNQRRQFWLTWDQGYVSIGRLSKPGTSTLLGFQYMENLVNVKYFGVATAKDQRGEWCIPQDLPAGKGGSWTAYPDNIGQELEVMLGARYLIHAVEIQGAPDADQWVTEFRILYRINPFSQWSTYADKDGMTLIDGCTDRNTKVKYTLETPIIAAYIKIQAISWQSKISMRLEVYGCLVQAERCPVEGALRDELYLDKQWFTASSYEPDYPPWMEREQGQLSGAWRPLQPYGQEWLQVEFEVRVRVHAVTTQGAADAGWWVKEYVLSYSHECWRFDDYQEPYGTVKKFTGNSDGVSKVKHELKSNLHVKCVRLWPTQWEGGIHLWSEFDISYCPGCQPMAMIEGDLHRIPDSQLTASSIWDAGHGPNCARLHMPNANGCAGAWCAGTGDRPPDAWLQADFGFKIRIYGVATQGRNGPNQQWVTFYKLQYSEEATGDNWMDYMEGGVVRNFTGNVDRDTVRKHYFPHRFMAWRARIVPLGFEGHVALRFEFYGCTGASSDEEIGCFADTWDRDLPYEQLRLTQEQGGMTQSICSTHCADKGYAYAGAQYGSECYCGNNYGRYGQSVDCNMPCTGDLYHPPSMCGGAFANTIIATGLAPSFSRCAEGYKEYNNKCWRAYVDQAMSWHAAKFACAADNAELATVNSQDEQDFVFSTYEEEVWIGLHCQATNYYFEWANQEPVLYTNWYRREPNDFGNGEDCVEMRIDGMWNDNSCGEQRYFLCQKGKEVLPPVEPTLAPEGCQSGWVAYRWKCYHLRKDLQTWSAHKRFCEGYGGNLARIEDSQEQSFIQSQLIGIDSGRFWHDLNDQDSPGSYKWSNGQNPTFTQWGTGQPDESSSPSCVSLSEDDHGTWFDDDCESAFGAVCETDRTTETRPPTLPTNPDGSCTGGWSEFGNYCYQFADVLENQMRSWDDARSYCTDQGADLVSIHSEEEHTFIYEKIAIRGAVHIGLNTKGNDGFKWSDGSEANFFRWDVDQPDDDSMKECVEMTSSNGRWATVNCGATRNWVCKIGKGSIPHTTPSIPIPTEGPPGSCYPDGDEWKFYEGKCYYVSGTENSPTMEPFLNAQAWCNDNGAHLTSIHNEATNRFLMGQVQDVETYDMWIGLNELNGNGYEWIDGSPVEYTNWDQGGPDDTAQRCVTMSTQYYNVGKWRNRNCGLMNHFICAKSVGAAPITTPRPTPMPGGCPEGYAPFESKCFKFVDTSEQWAVARERCEAENAQLAAINDVYDQSFITMMLQNHRQKYWIGLHRQFNQFVWADSSNVGYTNWAPGEPNGGDYEECVHVYDEEKLAGRWNDQNCADEFPYICMKYRDPSLPEPEMPDNGRCKSVGNGMNWFLWNDDCYKILAGSMRSWEEAEGVCQQDGAHLTSITSPYENGFIHGTLAWYDDRIQENQNIWIGLSNKDNGGSYLWSDSWSVVYTRWESSQPDRVEPSCVRLAYRNGEWYDEDCNTKRWALCKHSLKDPSVTAPPPSGQCPMAGVGESWLEYGDACYMFGEDKVNLAEARHRCYVRSADLASIHSDEETDWILTHLPNTAENREFWIGLIKTNDGGFIWTDSSAYGYTNWRNGEPSDTDGSQGENCVELYENDGTWNDIRCDVSNAYVCKYTKGSVTQSSTQVPSLGSTGTGGTTRPTGSTNSGPPVIPSTVAPDVPLPPVSGGSAMAPGGIIGLVFFMLFLLMALIIVVLFIMRRRGQPIPVLGGSATAYPSGADTAGFENPTYGPGGPAIEPAGDSNA